MGQASVNRGWRRLFTGGSAGLPGPIGIGGAKWIPSSAQSAFLVAWAGMLVLREEKGSLRRQSARP